MKKNLIFALTLLAGVVAMAAEHEAHGGGHDENAIPLTEIGWQAANVGILAIGLFFFLRKTTIEAFAKRKSDFLAQAEKTKAALKQAEDELRDTKTKLANLENGEAKALETAKHEAATIKANLIKDAEAQALKIKADAEMSIRNEVLKAKMEINQMILNEAVGLSKATLSSSSATSSTAENSFLAQVENSKNMKAVH